MSIPKLALKKVKILFWKKGSTEELTQKLINPANCCRLRYFAIFKFQFVGILNKRIERRILNTV